MLKWETNESTLLRLNLHYFKTRQNKPPMRICVFKSKDQATRPEFIRMKVADQATPTDAKIQYLRTTNKSLEGYSFYKFM